LFQSFTVMFQSEMSMHAFTGKDLGYNVFVDVGQSLVIRQPYTRTVNVNHGFMLLLGLTYNTYSHFPNSLIGIVGGIR